MKISLERMLLIHSTLLLSGFVLSYMVFAYNMGYGTALVAGILLVLSFTLYIASLEKDSLILIGLIAKVLATVDVILGAVGGLYVAKAGLLPDFILLFLVSLGLIAAGYSWWEWDTYRNS